MDLIAKPVDLWRRLRDSAGLELRLKSGRAGRDADIEEALRQAFEVTPISRTLFQPEKESDMPTPKPPYPAAFRQQMVELVRAGRGVVVVDRKLSHF